MHRPGPRLMARARRAVARNVARSSHNQFQQLLVHLIAPRPLHRRGASLMWTLLYGNVLSREEAFVMPYSVPVLAQSLALENVASK